MNHAEVHKYELVIYWSAEDRRFLVEVPDLPGCMADGDSPEAAAANTAEVISVWIDTAREIGRDIPEPTRRRAAV